MRILFAIFFFFAAMPNVGAKSFPKIRGIAFGHYTDIKNAKLDEKIKELKELGANFTSLVMSWSTQDVRSNRIAPRENHTTPDSVLIRMISRTHARGLKILLFPIIDVRRRKPLEWRGTIKPQNWEEWWINYSRYIMHYARIAESTKVEMFCVGSELVSTENMYEHWATLIRQVRRVYRGEIIYSANWDHYRPVTFWKLVDGMGITAYHSLAKNPGAPEAEMLASWIRERDKLVEWAKELKRRFIFTEVGYPSLDGGAANPWDYTQLSRVNLEEQRRAFSAFVRAWDKVPELNGVFFWDWYGEGGPKDTRYTPRGKPAAKVIQDWFGGGK
ncbi:MAG: hypothetical protein V1754_05815 [Pseudomonadota bacterium]